MIPINGNAHDLGDGFLVTRLLPQPGHRSVGPFVFFDYFGPVDFAPGKGVDVRPHPHIGLATVTYLFDGSQMHRDTLGSVQEIQPGDVNWMTAGRGIAHSERTGAETRAARPSPARHPELDRPAAEGRGSRALASSISPRANSLPNREERRDGSRSSPATPSASPRRCKSSPTSSMPMRSSKTAASLAMTDEHEERAIFVIDGEVQTVDANVHGPGTMLVLDSKEKQSRSTARGPTRVMLLGGAPLDGPAHICGGISSPLRRTASSAPSRTGRTASSA